MIRMGLAELIESGKMSDALILTVGLIEKSEHENVDVDALLAAYRLCHTKDTDIYLCTMIQSGILRILHNVTQKNVRLEDLLKIADTLSGYETSDAVSTYFLGYVADFLYQVAESMHGKGDVPAAYRFLSALASLKVPVRVEYILLENALKGSLQLPADYSVFSEDRRKEHSVVGVPENVLAPVGVNHRRLRVDILLEFPTVWCKVKSLYEALSKDASFDCRLVAIDMQERSWDSAKEYPAFLQFLNDRNLPFVPEAAYRFAERRPDVLIYTNPYDWHHPKFSVENVRSYGIRIVYLPYSIPFFVDEKNKVYLYDLPIHRHAWRVYVRSSREIRKYGMYCQSGNAHVSLAGAPLADYISEQKEQLKPDARFKKTFLWGIDYGFWDQSTATFREYGERILRYFAEHPQIGLIVRPHPLFYGAVTKMGFMSEEEVQAFYRHCEDIPNVTLDLCGDLTGSFCKSDALISDISSILVEYLLMGRPVLYLGAKGAPNYREYPEDDADVLVHYYSGDSFEHIVRFIEMVTAGEDPMCKERVSVLDKYLYHTQVNAGETIKEMLKDALQNQ